MIRKTGHQPATPSFPYRDCETTGHTVSHSVGSEAREYGGTAVKGPANDADFSGSIDRTGMTKIMPQSPANAPTANYFGTPHGDPS